MYSKVKYVWVIPQGIGKWLPDIDCDFPQILICDYVYSIHTIRRKWRMAKVKRGNGIEVM